MSIKSSRPTKPPLQPSSKSSLSTHLAAMELNQRILTSLSKLSDRDTHQIAVDDLQTIIQTISPANISMILNSLYDATNDTTTNKPAVKKEAIKLLSFLCATHIQPALTHLTKIITHIVKRLKDSDSGIKDSCIGSIGHLSCLYLKDGSEVGDGNIGCLVSWFVKPLFEAMNEQDKGVQSGAAMCMARMVDMTSDHPPVLAFQKLCGRICKFLNSPNFLANAALLPVVSSLSKVGAISPHVLEPLLQSIHDCVGSPDWATRKAAADTLIVLALHSNNLITQKPISTITILESCRFDKIKPVRDSMTEALQLWKQIAEGCVDQKPNHREGSGTTTKFSIKNLLKLGNKKTETPPKEDQIVSEKTIGTKKKAPPLSDMELNPEFFQRLERRVSGEVEVVVNDTEAVAKSKERYERDEEVSKQGQVGNLERGDDGPSTKRREFENNGNLLGIQRQLLQLERQQAYLMNMLQDFKGGSRDGMVTLENRVWGLERVVEDMARNMSVVSTNSTQRGSSSYMNESRGRSLGQYNGFADYPNIKLGSNMRGRGSWDYPTHSRMGSRRGVNHRPTPKGVGPIRFGEGPSARSVWKASKDEATLEAIRVATPEDENLSWKNAMDGVRLGDFDSAFSEVLSCGDDFLLVKLMDRTGPVIDQLSSDVASEVLHAVAQFLQEPNLVVICLSWIQQVLVTTVENGSDVLEIHAEVKREILTNLNEASSTIDLPEDWEGLMPDQLMLQLASNWNINIQHLNKW